MPKRPGLSPESIKTIQLAVDMVMDRVKVRFLGPGSVEKRIYVSYTPELSMPGLFLAANAEEMNRPDLDTMKSLLEVAGGYLDSERERMKSKVVKAVESAIKDAASGKAPEMEAVLRAQLHEVFGEMKRNIVRIIETESTVARNIGVLDGILKVNEAAGNDDPVIYFVVVRDSSLCDECKRLHLLDDGVIPRVWRLSEASHAYHERGDDSPSIGGEHPHCRCSLVTLMRGYGFDKNGMITYISPDHDEFARQRGMEKSEPNQAFDDLLKAEVDARDVVRHFRQKLGFTASHEGANHTFHYHPEAPHIKLIVQRGGHGATMDRSTIKKVMAQTGTRFRQGQMFVPDPAHQYAAEYRRRGLL